LPARLISLLFLLAALICGTAMAGDKSVLMITWRGQTEAEQGFVDRLEQLGIHADYEFFDAARDQDKLAGYLRENQERIRTKDLIYTFGTTATQTVQNFDTGNVPHVFNIVVNPVGTGIAASLASPETGITGAKMGLSPEVNLRLLEKIYAFDKVAVLFDAREDNAASEADRLGAAAREMNKDVLSLRLSPDAETSQLLISSLKPQLASADVIYVTASSSFIAHSSLLNEILPQDVVSIGSSTAYINEGLTLAFGTEYRERGEAAAELAAKLLVDGLAPNDLPINEVDPDEAVLYLNMQHKAVPKLHLNEAGNPIIFK